ncbi:hypothetical protein GGI23_001733 [Coemansia sp. RSA 2559]|nr:hypothetical protein GGI23_001733 [Coemansia sp. RSA 2559]
MASSLQTTYTLHIPGLGASIAQHASELHINGMGLEELVVRVTTGSGKTAHRKMLWLDIEQPTMRDVNALAKVFGIRRDIAADLLRGVAADVQTHSSLGTHRMPTYACRCYPGEVYVRWAEWEPDEEQLSLRQGNFDEAKLATGTAFGTSGGATPRKIGEVVNGSMGSHLREAFQKLVHAAWPPQHSETSGGSATACDTQLADCKQQKKENSRGSLVAVRTLPCASDRHSHLGDRFRKRSTTGARTTWIQSWMGQRVLLTFHQNPSHVVADVMDELAATASGAAGKKSPALAEESILQALICRWVRDSGGQCTGWLDQIVQRIMDISSTRAKLASFQWVRAVASCRRLNLIALRNCHEGLRVLRTLRLLRGLATANAHAARLEGPSASSAPRNKHAGARHWHGASFAHILSVSQISRYTGEMDTSTAVYDMLYSQQKAVFRRHKEIERRLAMSDSLAAARQRGWLLLSEKKILHRMNIWLLAHFIYEPIQLWRDLNNINETATPGKLMQNSTLLFYWQLPVFAAWAIVAYFVYTAHVKRLYAREWKKIQPTTSTYKQPRMEKLVL